MNKDTLKKNSHWIIIILSGLLGATMPPMTLDNAARNIFVISVVTLVLFFIFDPLLKKFIDTLDIFDQG